MGTSSIYGGPNDKNPLLPEGFDEEYNRNNEDENNDNSSNEAENIEENASDDEKQINQARTGSWQETKRSMSQYITGHSNNKGRVASNYVRATGGSQAASNQAISGRRATVQLGSFLSSVAQIGIHKTLENLQIDYMGKSIETLLSEIVNLISPSSNTKEDAVARNALIEVECKMYEFILENNMDIKSLDHMDEAIFDALMENYVTAYIFERMLSDLQSRFEKYADNAKVALQKENEFRDFIQISVELELQAAKLSKLDYQDKSIDRIIKKLYSDCYRIMEVFI
ncbi:MULTISPECIES: Qat anti-phage system associated protein QatB [Paenibacillus]|uniref:Uncharacterized protein n=1 Tax=Paenibacillus pabuli TaxID=1472 RepID=A0A855Y1I7_9BACL|nr:MULTISPECIES: Qat anti-phage system associated protein QatB [Paenibacillus]PWW43429.1 hypothetical protein DET56_103477 [Paenibacillus pabuli]PXW09336.1 hypothetical protein DEU73_103474 [Paenibacillus taichungensis]